MQIGSKSFAQLAEEKRFGMVVLGAGAPHEEWVSGIADLLAEGKITTSNQCFEEAFILDDNIMKAAGRTDLVVLFSSEAKPDVGKLAMWRLKFGGVMWIEDFIANHAKDYSSGHGFYDSLED